MARVTRSAVLAAAVDLRKACGERDALTMQCLGGGGRDVDGWYVGGMLLEMLPSCYSCGS